MKSMKKKDLSNGGNERSYILMNACHEMMK